MIRRGDCVDVMRAMEPCSVDAVVTDPPYGLEFMGKEWDRLASTPERVNSYQAGPPMQEWHYRWAVEALRVLKPGGYLLAFGGSRTYHRLACAVEDAGFEIRDRIEVNGLPVVECSDGSLAWWYGSGFPKSLNVERAVAIETCPLPGRHFGTTLPKDGERQPDDHVCAPTPESEPWHGYGTAAKPAHEPIVVARKPLSGTVAQTVLAHGTGALNIDGARIGYESAIDQASAKPGGRATGKPGALAGGTQNDATRQEFEADNSKGRWPANVVLVHSEDCVPVGTRAVASDGHFPSARPAGVEIGTTGHAGQDGLVERSTRGETQEVWECVEGCPVRALEEQTGELRSGERRGGERREDESGWRFRGGSSEQSAGGASRFFYTAKTSRAERNAGLEGFEERAPNWSSGDQNPGSFQGDGTKKAARNFHPTVKPIDVMRWLVKLVTPPGGTILDPFMGSGTTGAACVLEGFEFVGIEKYPRDGEPGDPDYFGIAEARIAFWREHGEDGLRIVRERDQARAKRAAVADTGQLDLGV